MWRHLVALSWVLCVMLSGSALHAGDPKAAASAPADIKGAYARPHDISMFDPVKGVHETSEVNDCLWVEPKGESLAFDLLVMGANAHMCSVSGDAVKAGDVWVFKDKGTGDDVCEIHITLTKEAVLLHEQSNSCKVSFCGARASIGELRFSRSTHDPKGGRCNVD